MGRPEQPKYLIDANTIIAAYRNYYGFDFCPGYWDFLSDTPQIESIDRVKAELNEGQAELDKWLAERFESQRFLSTKTSAILSAYTQLIEWSNSHEQYSEAAKARFADGADAWLVAAAQAKEAIIVTMEVSAPRSKTSIKIPDVCNAHSVRHINTYQMLRELEARFQLAKQP